MNFSRFFKVVILTLVCNWGPVNASEPHSLSNTHVHAFASQVRDAQLQIVVSLPFGYDAANGTYPLIVALDGDVMFGLTSEIPRLMSFEGSMPNVIVASILYGDFQSWIKGRNRDFHSHNDGSKAFLETLRTEILPFLASNYRIDENSKTLYGHSSAGLFSLYAGINNPKLFQHILASSPSLEEEPALSETLLEQVDKSQVNLPKIFISLGGAEEKSAKTVLPFVKSLQSYNSANTIKFQHYEDTPHMAVIGGAYADGMRWLFSK